MESGMKQGRGSAGAYATTNKNSRCLFFFFHYYYYSFLLLILWSSSDSKFNSYNGGGGSMGAVMVGATNHTVGGSNRWDLSVDYDTWASTTTFYVGDNLVFTWTGTHDVVNTTTSGYNACNSSSSAYMSSPVTIPLTAPGTTYYICSISDHCSANGMKVSVTTLSSSNSSESSTTTPNTPPSSSSDNSSSPSPSSTFPLFFPSCFVTLVLSISSMLVLL